MIIKSMPYKDANFQKLYAYIQHKAVGEQCVLRNFHLVDDQEEAPIIEAFEENVKLLPARKNGNLFYHEIISIKPSDDVPFERQFQALHDLAHHYLEQRARDHLAFGKIHFNTGNLHVHLMVSANALYSSRRHRLPKARFASIQKESEKWLNATFPDLQQEPCYQQRTAGRQAPSRSERERSKRTRKPSHKQELTQKMRDILIGSEREGEFSRSLTTAGMKFYQRGRTPGVIFEGKKYRLKTLGVLKDYERAKARWLEMESRRRSLSEFYQGRSTQHLKPEFELPPVINPPLGWK